MGALASNATDLQNSMGGMETHKFKSSGLQGNFDRSCGALAFFGSAAKHFRLFPLSLLTSQFYRMKELLVNISLRFESLAIFWLVSMW